MAAFGIFQTALMWLCLAALALLAVGWLLCAMRGAAKRLLRAVASHPFAAVALSPLVLVLFVHGSTKPVTPTVNRIVLGSTMETPTSVSLEWRDKDGREIGSNQLVRVYWRDGYNTAWRLAAEGRGITNAVVSGFFVNRDTDWMVVAEDDGTEGEE